MQFNCDIGLHTIQLCNLQTAGLSADLWKVWAAPLQCQQWLLLRPTGWIFTSSWFLSHIFWALPLTGGWNPCRNRFCQLFSWYVPLPITLGRTVWTMPNLKTISQHMWPNFPRVTVPVKLALALVSIVGSRRVTAVGSGFCHLSQCTMCTLYSRIPL